MSLLTDEGIKRAMRHGDIVIHPFSLSNLTPIGYYIRVGGWIADLTNNTLLLPVPGTSPKRYKVAPGKRILILTLETVAVSRKIGGTFHTMVVPVAQGLSPISTTLDPGWVGALFVTVTNTSDKEIELTEGEAFTKLLFYEVRIPAAKPSANRATQAFADPGRPLEDLTKLRELVVRLAGEQPWQQTLTAEAQEIMLKSRREARLALTTLKRARKAGRIRVAVYIVLAAIEVALFVFVLRAQDAPSRIALLGLMLTVFVPLLILWLQASQALQTATAADA